MINKSHEASLSSIDVKHLYYFSIVAEEGSLRRAAERIFMAQPPLSRQIKILEERLGVALFVRHSKGLILTESGKTVLQIIKPLLQERERAFTRLRKEIRFQGKTLRIGFTTAFEQGVFSKLETRLHKEYGRGLHVLRASSPKLIKEVRQGRLNAALVALPLDAPGVMIRTVGYTEPLIIAMPASWPQALYVEKKEQILLESFNNNNLFWFKREKHPAFFDYCKALFTQTGFTPNFLEEPLEHDVLLARIASGEGLGLFAASFASIQRDGVLFTLPSKKDTIPLQLGIAVLPSNDMLGEELAATFMATHHPE